MPILFLPPLIEYLPSGNLTDLTGFAETSRQNRPPKVTKQGQLHLFGGQGLTLELKRMELPVSSTSVGPNKMIFFKR